MIRDSQIVVAHQGQAYTIYATGDQDAFWARRSGDSENVTDPQILTALYAAGRGAILSASLLSPDRVDLLGHTGGVRNLYDELDKAQFWKNSAEALTAFSEVSTAVFSLLKPKSPNVLDVVSVANDVSAALANLSNEVASEAFVLALMDASLLAAEDITRTIQTDAESILSRLGPFTPLQPVTTEEIRGLTENSLALSARHQVIIELGNVYLASIDDPWWQFATDIFSPIANFVAGFGGDVNFGAALQDTIIGAGKTIEAAVENAVEANITEKDALEVFENTAERIAGSSPEFYSADAISQSITFFTEQFTPPPPDPDTLPDKSPSGGGRVASSAPGRARACPAIPVQRFRAFR